jgi:hypothetical protein
LRREEAISVLKELLDYCAGLDGHYFELAPPNAPTSAKEGYQIIIKGALDQETIKFIQEMLVKHQLTCQIGSMWKTKHSTNKTDPDTLIIYKPTPKPT